MKKLSSFYRELKRQSLSVRVGMEASGHARWFERLLTELQFELWIEDAAVIRTRRVRKQKTVFGARRRCGGTAHGDSVPTRARAWLGMISL